MPAVAGGKRRAEERARARLRERLERRRGEIEQAFLTRSQAISDASAVSDPQYLQGLRAAVAVALDFAFDGIEQEDDRPPPPLLLLRQARLAARFSVSLDTVLRRYFACYSLLLDFVIDEAGRDGLLRGPELKHQLRTGAAVFDRLLAAVTEEYVREASRQMPSAEEQRIEQIDRLLDGELLHASALEYDFESYHVGLIGAGEGLVDCLRGFASQADCRLLAAPRGDGKVWAWLGRRRALSAAELTSHLKESRPVSAQVAIGESAPGLTGWRMTHRQAKAAVSLVSVEEPVVRYRDTALLASALKDDLLVQSLQELYVGPLRGGDGRKGDLRRTMRAYLDTGRNVSSTAALLRTSRQTVRNRLQEVEERLGRPIGECALELDLALRLDASNDALLFAPGR
jgi:PucR C-terminal helix-turn-helix domain/GGDEF-like domain